MQVLSRLPAASALLRPAAAAALRVGPGAGASMQARAFGIKTTLKVQEHLTRMIRRDQKAAESAPKAAKGAKDMQLAGPGPVRDSILASMPSELRTPHFPEPMRENTMDQ
ncbi:hypothetical protein IWQ57_002795, partial [Coemansia nantahalensis]